MKKQIIKISEKLKNFQFNKINKGFLHEASIQDFSLEFTLKKEKSFLISKHILESKFTQFFYFLHLCSASF